MAIRISPFGCLFLILLFALFIKSWKIILLIIIGLFILMTIISLFQQIKNRKINFKPKKGEVYKVCPNCGESLDRTCEVCPYCNCKL